MTNRLPFNASYKLEWKDTWISICLLQKTSNIENKNNIKYAVLQKQAIEMALSKGMLILTGGPGTGKTTTLNAIISILKENGLTPIDWQIENI